MRALLIISAISAATCVQAQSIDCDSIRSGKIPFQLNLRLSDGKPSVFQIARFDHLVRTVAEKHEGGAVNRTTYQANFMRSIVRPNGKPVAITWNVPTDSFFWDAKIYYAEGNFSDGQKLVITFRLVDEAQMKVGPCTFNAKHFVSNSIYLVSSRTTSMESEIWFSPELQAPLKLITKLKNDRGDKLSGGEVIGISTSFTPLP